MEILIPRVEDAVELTEEEVEALEDAEDLAIAKERMANSDPSTWISLDEARALLKKSRS